jgi:uncharacterized membrane protein YgcG
LQHAAQMREAKSRSSQRLWFASLRRIAVTLAVVLLLFVSGTGLVRAASTTLPGDNLYPVKRTWEDVLLLFTFNLQEREALEIEHENERLHELMELFAKGLSEEVDFAGTVTSQNGNEWIVNGVRVLISDQTEVREGPIMIGSAVRVHGPTQGKGIVLAERIRVLSSDERLPEVEYHDEEEDDDEESTPPSEDNSSPGSGQETPRVEETNTPETDNSNSGSGDGNDSSINENLNDNGGSGDNSDNNNDDSDDNSGSDGNNDNSSNGDGNNDNGDDSGGGGNDNGSGGDEEGGGDGGGED